MSYAVIAKKDRKLSIPHAAIVQAILRCENGRNPAVIEKQWFTLHVRQLPADEGTGWIVRLVDKSDPNLRKV